MYDVDSF